MSKKVNKMLAVYRLKLDKLVSKRMKQCSRTKEIVRDIKNHFKCDTYALSFEGMRGHLNVLEFATLLEKLKCKIYYCPKHRFIVFKPKQRTKRRLNL